jgi:hypothetical protein
MPRLFSANAGVLAVESFFTFAAPVTVDTVIAVIHAVNNLGGGNGWKRIGSTSNPLMDGRTTGIVSGTTVDGGRRLPLKRSSA